MARTPPNNAKGTRDYLPRDLLRRNRVFALLRETFERYGYEPLETPAVELTSVLEGKYGAEGDKLLFRILKRGQDLETAATALRAPDADSLAAGAISRALSDEALRYDLTVPFARVIAAHQQEIIMPFRRYQMQPVWRAERPQRGRFREFYQCDVDCVGSSSVTVEAEMLAMVSDVFARLGFTDVTININHRELLNALLESEGVAEAQQTSVLVAIDKLDKIGVDGVRGELERASVPAEITERLLEAVSMTGTPTALAQALGERTRLGASARGARALGELEALFSYLAALGVPPERYRFDLATVRGLSYYTGIIYETVSAGAPVGSLCSGGRYDKLIGQFLGRDLPCVGISFGIDRMFTAMEILGLNSEDAATGTQALVTLLGGANVAASFACASLLRRAGIATEVYADETKALKAQLGFANKKGIPLACIIGDEERATETVTLRDLRAERQERVPLAAVTSRAREWVGAHAAAATSISEIC